MHTPNFWIIFLSLRIYMFLGDFCGFVQFLWIFVICVDFCCFLTRFLWICVDFCGLWKSVQKLQKSTKITQIHTNLQKSCQKTAKIYTNHKNPHKSTQIHIFHIQNAVKTSTNHKNLQKLTKIPQTTNGHKATHMPPQFIPQ